VISRAAASVDLWMFRPGAGRRLWAVRCGFALLFGVRLAIGNHHELGGQPAALFRPQLLWRWLTAMPSSEVIAAVQVVGVVGAIAVLITRRSRLPLVVAWGALVFVDGLLAARGKIMHNDLLALLAAVPVLMAPADGRPGDRELDARYGWPVNGALVVVAFAYFFSGLAKVISSGPGWVFSDNLANILEAARHTDRPPTDVVSGFLADRVVLAQLMAASTLIVELGFLVVLWRPRARPVFALAATALHSGIWLTLGLDYWSWVATVLIVLIDWPAVADWIVAWKSPGPVTDDTSGRSLRFVALRRPRPFG
jgi:hypothetical protein